MSKKDEIPTLKAEIVSDKPKVEPNKWQSLLTLGLVFLIVNTLFLFFFKPAPPKAIPEKTPANQQVIIQAGNIEQSTIRALSADIQAKEAIVINTSLAEYVFDNEGAKLVSAKLSQYLDKDKHALELIPTNKESVNSFYRLNFNSQDIHELDTAIYKAERLSPNDVKFTYITRGMYKTADGLIVKSTIPAGLLIEKTFSFTDDYKYIYKVSVRNIGEKAILLNQIKRQTGDKSIEGAFEIVLGPGLEDLKDKQFLEHGTVYGETLKKVGGGIFKKMFSGNGGANSYEVEPGTKDAFFIGSKYFLNILFPQDSISGAVFNENQDDRSVGLIAKAALLNQGESLSISFDGYFGPKEYARLKALSPALIQIMGIKPFFGVPISLWVFRLLNLIFGFVGNYGVAIIILTILIKILFYPLSNKSFESMQKMQQLKPELEKVKEKFKGNPQKINEETMRLYKKFGANPMGGCLPMLLQLPLFFALFAVLQFAIELRGQPFITLPFHLLGHQMWIVDLATKDPTYILPILMGISMFFQQKMSTPVGVDDAQAKMMMWMPVIFTFMFMNFPSGLVLYWLVNNLLTMAQQAYVAKKI